MSRINGDRSRFDRQRKAKLHDRERIREMRKQLQSPAQKTSAVAKSK